MHAWLEGMHWIYAWIASGKIYAEWGDDDVDFVYGRHSTQNKKLTLPSEQYTETGRNAKKSNESCNVILSYDFIRAFMDEFAVEIK